MNTDLRVLIRYLRAFIEKSPSEPFPSLNIAPLNPGVMNKFLLSVLCFLLLNLPIQAQEVWDLERCVREALDKNLTIEQINSINKGTISMASNCAGREYPASM